MDEKKARLRTHKKYFKLSKNKVWLSILLYFVVMCLCVLAIAGIVELFILFAVYSGIENEFDSKTQLVKMNEELATEDEPYLLLDKADMDYFIRDAQGSTVYSRGKITCSEKGFDYLLSLGASSNIFSEKDDNSGEVTTTIYQDTEVRLVKPDEDQSVEIDLWAVAKQMFRVLENSGSEAERLQLPVWLTAEMDNGSELVFKASVTMRSTDVAMTLILVIVMLALLVIVFVILTIHTIANAVSRRKVTKLFFTDMKVKGNNWLWFLLHAEQKLGRFGSAKKQFAMVDLVFNEYRRFCICHSVDEGEAVLGRIYSLLGSQLNKKELLAHSSEDSFAMMLEYTDETSLRERVNTLLASLSAVDTEHSFTYHAGIMLIPAKEGAGLLTRRRDIDVESDYNLVRAASASLEGKETSAYAVYDDKLVEEQRWADTVQELQQKALDNDEFVVYYQPKYDPRTHELRGAEALIRWQSPEHGFLTPYRFIPIFEKNGFITEIDHYMITHVARAQKKWLDEGQKCVPISVNVSRAHFIESDLAEQIRDIVDGEGAPRELIEIELTESAFFDDKNAMINTITKLKEYGFAVSMDDFGSGYSSLNSLKDMPLDVLKLDAEFFRGEAADTDRGEIVVKEAIQLAKSLNMRTVAEGVEVKEQVEFLASQGCDMIQGYYFAKPMPADDYEQRMKAGRSDGEEA